MLMLHKADFVRHILLAAVLLFSVTGFAYKSPVEVPAIQSRLAPYTPLIGVAKAGSRIVAVGLYGHIVYSDDEGKTWTQAKDVPVSVDLLSVSFANDKSGWATGHGGVVLHTSDGGDTWTKQLDGNSAAVLTTKYFDSKTGAERTPELEHAAVQAKALVDEKNTQTLLAVSFENDQRGYAVGTFNRIFRTEDGGKNWTPLMDRSNNPKEMNFYDVRTDSKATYLTGEQGLVWKYDNSKNSFTQLPTGYKGTLFGIVVDGSNLLVFGMRGSLMHSSDEGKSWEKINLGMNAGLSGGAVLSDGRIAVANQAGSIMVSADHGKTFTQVKTAKPMSYFGILPLADKKVVLVGSEGVRVETIQ